MGWTHALDLAQAYFSRLVCKALSIGPGQLLRDGSEPLTPKEGVPAVYVDNFVYVADEEDKSERAVRAVMAECDRRGLSYHGQYWGQREAEELGWTFDGDKCVIRPKAARAWKLILALHQILTVPYLTSRQMECVVGHFTFVALLRRPLLSLMSSVYAFSQAGFKKKRLAFGPVL